MRLPGSAPDLIELIHTPGIRRRRDSDQRGRQWVLGEGGSIRGDLRRTGPMMVTTVTASVTRINKGFILLPFPQLVRTACQQLRGREHWEQSR